MNDFSVWSLKYRPKKVDDLILPDKLKDQFKGYLEKRSFPDLLLNGNAGMGKTTIAMALCDELGWPMMKINASAMLMEQFRVDIPQFVTSRSLDETKDANALKVVFLDEADNLTNAIQTSLRAFMEEFSFATRFILTCNNKNKIIDPLRSRCCDIEFVIPNNEREKLCKQFAFRICNNILKNENVTFDPKVILSLTQEYAPDYRRLLNEIQGYSTLNGHIDDGILRTAKIDLSNLFNAIKSKSWKDARYFVSMNKDNSEEFFVKIFEEGQRLCTPDSIPNLILIIEEFYNHASTAKNVEIPLAAMVVKLMKYITWK